MTPDPRHAPDIAIAVVIPAHRQPGLLAEALASALAQEGAPPTALVVVDDGCPFPETGATARAFAAAHPGRVFALRRPNGGLSAARNTGIDFALAAFPALEAVYFLDADNRLHPPFLARAIAALRAAPPVVGWVYPDFDMFGLPLNGSGAGEWSLLAHLSDNLCEAGSLVRRAMLEAGLRFDPGMRGGFEDWAFWLQAGTLGFRGQHLPESGFRYRRRPESMLAEAERQRAVLLQRMRETHRAALFNPRAILALEAAEAPRFALHEAGAPGPRWLLDPAEEAGPHHPAAAAREALLAARERPGATFHPPLLCFAAAGALAPLRTARLARGIFWRAEHLLRRDPGRIVAVELLPPASDAATDAATLAETRAPGPVAGAALLFCTPAALDDAAALEALRTAPPAPEDDPDPPSGTSLAATRIALGLPTGIAPPPPGAAALNRMVEEAAALAAAAAGRTAIPAEWRSEFRAPRAGAAQRAFGMLGLGAVLPCRPDPAARSIGFVLPLLTHGGVERVVQNQAAVLRRHGWRTHLLVLGEAATAELPAALREAFDSITLAGPLPGATAEAPFRYLGAATADLGDRAEAADAAGLLAHCEVVVNTHALGAHGLMARLRRLGIRTLVGLHLVERQRWGEPIGNPHVALAYEHAYDGALVISEGLAAWCVAQGWPAAKLHLLRNAPGHATPEARIRDALAARAARGGGRLRALFLGRLDAQKGVDRLAALIAATRDAVDWRVVGRPVLAEAVPVLGVAVEPPVSDPAALDALHGWADVLVLPSRFEGVPLAVLEAQRMGCAVVATEAGEIGEIVTQGVDGFLVAQRGREEAAIVAAMAALLRRLAADRPLLVETGRRAAARVAAAGWEAQMRGFLALLDRLVPPR